MTTEEKNIVEWLRTQTPVRLAPSLQTWKRRCVKFSVTPYRLIPPNLFFNSLFRMNHFLSQSGAQVGTELKPGTNE